MPAGLFALTVLFLIGCAPTERAKPVAEQWQPLDASECKPDEFGGFGVGADENEALGEAHSALAKRINSSVKVKTERTVNQQISDGEENLSSKYKSRTTIEAALPNAHDARIARKNKIGDKINIEVCMSRSDAAKGFVERLRPISASLEFSANSAIEAKHPRLKSEAWQKTQPLWSEFMYLQSMIEGLDKEKTALFEPASTLYAKAKDSYLSYCQTAKLHWKPKKENEYSSIAFSMLSKNLKMEKSACQGNGISLVYKSAEPDCSHKFGIYNCFYKPSLSLISCDGTEYLLLENAIEQSHQKQDLALEKTKDALKSADFWKEWEREIKEWRPKCE